LIKRAGYKARRPERHCGGNYQQRASYSGRRRYCWGRVEPQYTLVSAYPGKPAVLLNINRQPNANTVAVVDEVKAELAAMRGQISQGRNHRSLLRSVAAACTTQ